jgi:hypothetical protein
VPAGHDGLSRAAVSFSWAFPHAGTPELPDVPEVTDDRDAELPDEPDPEPEPGDVAAVADGGAPAGSDGAGLTVGIGLDAAGRTGVAVAAGVDPDPLGDDEASDPAARYIETPSTTVSSAAPTAALRRQ